MAETPLVEIYVSTNGVASGNGDSNNPVTLNKARELMYNARKNGNRVDIYIEEGRYIFTEPLAFTEAYSGTKECPVRFIAEGDVVFTSATDIPFSALEKITDNDIRNRVKSNLRDKIYKVDLDKFGIVAGDMPIYSGIDIKGEATEDKFLTYTSDNYDDVAVFTESFELPVAQYPNGEGNYHKWLKLIDQKSFSVEKTISKNWEDEKYAYIEGYPGYEYSCERNNVTVKDGIVTLNNPPRSMLRANGSNRYKVKHNLYELDVPGEWYIDREKNVLYIYPTSKVKEKGISVAANKMSLVTLRKAQYLTFDGITFDRIRGSAVLGTYWCNNVNFNNCTFSNITNQAIYIRADGNSSQYGKYLQAFNFTGGAQNVNIESNVFINIGAGAVEMYGGTRETLTDSGNTVVNNYFYNVCSKQKCNPNIILRGCGGKILNNEIHGGNFHAINIGSNNQLVKGNEIYNMARETGDTGLIYTGKTYTIRGTEISHNYLHDYGQIDRMLGDVVTGIYFDDRQSGMYVHHNILYPNAEKADGNGIQNNGGQHNRFEYNIIIDSAMPFVLSNRINYSITDMTRAITELMFVTGANEDVTLDDGVVIEGITEPYDVFIKEYPELADTGLTLKNPNETVKALAEKYPEVLNYGNLKNDIENGAELGAYRLLSAKIPMENKMIANVSNTAADYEQTDYENYGGVFKDNAYTLTKDDFVDFDNNDFRIKSTSSYYVEGMLDENFDFKTIGIQRKVNRQKTFELTYPENNSNVADISDVLFMWEKPVGADCYTVEIADNSQMENSKSYDTYYNWLSVKDLDKNTNKFYWRVNAKNISINSEVWQSEIKSFNNNYEIFIKADKPMNLFDISDDFNVNMLAKEGNAYNNRPAVVRYNIDEITKIIPQEYLEYRGIKYKFSLQDTENENAIYTNNQNYTYTLKDSEKNSYDRICIALAGVDPIKNFEIKFNYTDGTSSSDYVEIGRIGTSYYNSTDVDKIFWTNAIKNTGEISGENFVYAVSADVERNKVLESIVFNGGEVTDLFQNKVNYSTSKNIIIFAITGVLNQQQQTIVYNCNLDENADVNVILTGYSANGFETHTLNRNVKNNSMYQCFEIPDEIECLENKKCFVWSDLMTLKPLSESLEF